eukprot:scaffold2182_cov363-Pavlova_lutheri.AAC.1
MQTIDEVGGAIGSKGTGRSWQDLPRAFQRGTFNIPSKERNPQALSSLVWSTVVRRNVLKFCRSHGKGHCASTPQQQPFTSLMSPHPGTYERGAGFKCSCFQGSLQLVFVERTAMAMQCTAITHSICERWRRSSIERAKADRWNSIQREQELDIQLIFLRLATNASRVL